MSVLIVDDEELIRDLLADVLRDMIEDIELHEASQGEEALAVLKQKKVRLVITDISMPVMDGLVLIRNIREAGNNVVVVVLSSSLDEFDTARKLGANHCFNKNDFEKIKAIVRECFSKND
jgi:YesN/AraC family two-component response regulator